MSQPLPARTEPQGHPQSGRSATVLDRILLGATLALTAVLSLVYSSHRLMWNDEFLSFYTDSVSTARGVLGVQLHHPISLDPPTYHLLSHFAMDLIGRNAIALRLPALAGFLLMEWALFALVRRIGGGRAAVIAATFPLVTASFRYSAEGRPYGLLLGLYAASFTCWFIASRRERGRPIALLSLAVIIALAITSHYFGILILLPVGIAELARIRARRRLDVSMLAAMIAGLAAVALILPFAKALAPYRTHYYITRVSIHAVTQGYRELFIRYTIWPIPVQRAIAFSMLALTLLLIVAAWRRFRARPADEPSSLWAGLLALAVLPFFGFLMGRFVTHTMEVRYVIAAVLSFAICFALVLQRRLETRGVYLALYLAMAAAATLITTAGIRSVSAESQMMLASMDPSARLKAALLADPTARIYTQSLNDFYLDSYYASDPVLRNRLSLLYDEGREVRWLKHDTNAITAMNMQHFTTLSIVPYDQFLAQPRALLLDCSSGWEWVKRDLDHEHIPLTPLGHTLRCDLYRKDDAR